MEGFRNLSACELAMDALPIRPDARILDPLTEQLHPLERLRLGTFALAKRRREWLAGRLCAKAAARHLGVVAAHRACTRLAPAQLLITDDDDGRPSVAGARIFLSISHSRLRAVAVASMHAVGIDTETYAGAAASSLDDLLPAAEVRCTARHFSCGPIAARTVLWCLKEARFKCQGRGSFIPLARQWRVLGWRDDQAPCWAPGSDWIAPAPDCEWKVQVALDRCSACVVVAATPIPLEGNGAVR